MTFRCTALVALVLLAVLALRPHGPASVFAASDSPEVSADEKQVTETIELLGPTFTRLDTEHFVVLSDCERSWTQARAHLLERAYHQFTRMTERLGMPARAPDHKLLCVLINDYEAYKSFARSRDNVTAPWVAGYYASYSNRAVFYNDATSPRFEKARGDGTILPAQARQLDAQAMEVTISKTLHEATHLIAFNRGLQSRAHQAPFWITEGLAACFESVTPNQAFGPDHAVERREKEFDDVVREQRLIPLSALVAMNNAPPDDDETASVMYAESYALFRYLYRYKRAALAGYFRDLLEAAPGLNSPAKHTRMFEARFGDAASVEKAFLRAWSRRSSLADTGGE
ncbi:MAG TPA: DUF1570 domain-containing protein [Phycisphaerales bacterium]|nr:DUF1570 domain-containing protein [Phycisphaerales bacterium]